MRIPILGTGLSGLVGTRVVELLEDKYDFTDLSFKTGVDITDYDQVFNVCEGSAAKTILHMAAKTDVDGCEDDKILGEDGPAYMVNVEGTKNIVNAAKKLNLRVLYISTDFVFDGTKDFYTEEDEPNPVNWYGYTKHEGETTVLGASISHAVVRLSYPYRSSFDERTDFVRRIMEKMAKGEKLLSLTDHIFTPTFIDDIAGALDMLIEREFQGIFHVVGSQNLSPYEATGMIAKTFNLNGKYEKVTRHKYFAGRAFRPCRLALKNDKITKLGAKMRTFCEGLMEVKRQLALL